MLNNIISENLGNGIETEGASTLLTINGNQIANNNAHGVLLRATASLQENTIDGSGQPNYR